MVVLLTRILTVILLSRVLDPKNLCQILHGVEKEFVHIDLGLGFDEREHPWVQVPLSSLGA